MYVYHRNLGFPDTLKIPNSLFNLEYTNHAQERTILYNLKLLPKIVRINKDNVYEIETRNNKRCRKVLIRIKYDNEKDMVLVLQILRKKLARVVTLWINDNKDDHKTINIEKYTIPQNKKSNGANN